MNYLLWLGELIDDYRIAPLFLQFVEVLTLIVLFATLLGVLYYAIQARKQNEDAFRPVVVMEFQEGGFPLPYIRNMGPGPAFNIEVENIISRRNTWTAKFRQERNFILESGEKIQTNPSVTRPGRTETAIQEGKVSDLIKDGLDRKKDPIPVVLLSVRITFDSVAGHHYLTEQDIEYREIPAERTRTIFKSSRRI